MIFSIYPSHQYFINLSAGHLLLCGCLSPSLHNIPSMETQTAVEVFLKIFEVIHYQTQVAATKITNEHEIIVFLNKTRERKKTYSHIVYYKYYHDLTTRLADSLAWKRKQQNTKWNWVTEALRTVISYSHWASIRFRLNIRLQQCLLHFLRPETADKTNLRRDAYLITEISKSARL